MATPGDAEGSEDELVEIFLQPEVDVQVGGRECRFHAMDFCLQDGNRLMHPLEERAKGCLSRLDLISDIIQVEAQIDGLYQKTTRRSVGGRQRGAHLIEFHGFLQDRMRRPAAITGQGDVVDAGPSGHIPAPVDTDGPSTRPAENLNLSKLVQSVLA